MLVNDAARECAAAIVRAKPGYALVGEDFNDERVLSAAHPKGTDARILRMDRHRIGDEGLGLPASAPVLRFALCCTACAGIAGSDGVKFDIGDFH